ncbi:MAG: imelysin family protein [Polyangiales bacterium]
MTVALLSACGSSDDGGTGESTDELGRQAALTYARIAYQAYSDSLERAEALDAALVSFVAEPSSATQDGAKASWLAAREPYLQTEVYRFYDGPIDNPADGPEIRLNAWPMDEAHVDYTRDDPSAGIINSTDLSIDEATLRGANEAGGEENIAVGFHPIEFLLWGQDDTDPSNAMSGRRPFTDYVTGETGTADNQDRRAAYLALLGELLTDDLQIVVDAWRPDLANNFRASFEAGSWESALEKMLTGMIVLSGFEMAGQRLQVALDNGDQEDEHSCFSDNTHRDMAQDARGVQNVWLGEYQALNSANSISGTGVRDVVAARDPDLADQISAQIAESVARAEALRPSEIDPPFDLLISLGNLEGNKKVQDLIDSLLAQESLLQRAFATFGLSVPEP